MIRTDQIEEIYKAIPHDTGNSLQKLATQVVTPSYISEYYALKFYGAIPEAVFTFTLVTTEQDLKFEWRNARFEYKHLPDELFCDYERMVSERQEDVFIDIAKPHKAVFDLLWLYPFYDTVQECIYLRIDESFPEEDFDLQAFKSLVEPLIVQPHLQRYLNFLTAYGLN